MASNLKDHFYFNTSERKSILTLLIMLIGVFVFYNMRNSKVEQSHRSRLIFEEILEDQSKVDAQPIQKSKNTSFSKKSKSTPPFDTIESANSPTSKLKHKSSSHDKAGPIRANERFEFDPNDVTLEQLISLGLSRYAANNWIKYREKGGVFYDAKEVAMVYGLEQSLVNDLEPYIHFKSNKVHTTEKAFSKFSDTKSPEPRPKINLNTASYDELVSLYGIGNFYANEIIKQREKLGGIHHLDQLKDIYKMRDSTILLLQNQVLISTEDVSKLNINLVTQEELILHPYISYKLASSIINYRQNHGSYQAVEDVRKLYSINDELYEKIKPYLTTQ